ncbi:sensor histidine kinase [Primorskyibacter sp. 2E233]|uniref:sensor histidine kinase n=1 Tax=Primorskyibacter sp. 2E233 TaxID=3413431 RepID=UPI003BF1B201
MRRGWRPSLGLVLGGGLFGTLVISLAGLVVFRYLGPEIGYRKAALLLGAGIAASTAILGWLLVRLLLRPITALQTYAAQVQSAPQDPADPPPHFGTRELHATALSVMNMAETLRDRESNMRSYSNHVTHEIKTPVAAIRAAVELLEDGTELNQEDRQLVARIGGAGRQIESQLEALRRAARARELRYIGQCTLAQALDGMDHHDLDIALDGDDLELPLSKEGVQIVLGHLLHNAKAHGATSLRLSQTKSPGGVTLRVQDNGAGISNGNLPHVFEPFFTTRRDSDGTGMGLAIARTILNAHRADIAAIPADQGALFELRFAG